MRGRGAGGTFGCERLARVFTIVEPWLSGKRTTPKALGVADTIIERQSFGRKYIESLRINAPYDET